VLGWKHINRKQAYENVTGNFLFRIWAPDIRFSHQLAGQISGHEKLVRSVWGHQFPRPEPHKYVLALRGVSFSFGTSYLYFEFTQIKHYKIVKNKSMSGNKKAGDDGEKEVIELIACPNCGKKLMLLPPGYPLYDVQCTGCSFRAQVKLNNTKPHKEIFGATWEIMNKVLKAGFITPPLFVIFKWKEDNQKREQIRFYPFIPKKNLKSRSTKIKKTGRELKMFNYVGINELPYFVVLEK
jgi:DNA-directed RNA polymerase subunit RPC12/RpoP